MTDEVLLRRRWSRIVADAERIGFTHVLVRKETGTIYGYGFQKTTFSRMGNDPSFEYLTTNQYKEQYLKK